MIQRFARKTAIGYSVSRWVCYRPKISRRLKYDVEGDLLKIYFPIMNSTLMILLANDDGQITTIEDCCVIIISWLEATFFLRDAQLHRREKSLDIEVIRYFVTDAVKFGCFQCFHQRLDGSADLNFNALLWDRFFFPQYFRDSRQIAIKVPHGEIFVRIPSLMIDICSIGYYNRILKNGVKLKMRVCDEKFVKKSEFFEFFTVFVSHVTLRRLFVIPNSNDKGICKMSRLISDYVFYWNLVFFITKRTSGVVSPSHVCLEVALKLSFVS